MILSDIREHIHEHGQVTLADLALHFDTDADALRGMLEVWVRKGQIHKRAMTASCGTSCGSCAPEATEVYSWGAADSLQVSVAGCTHDPL